ncbi:MULTISPECIES: S8 family peptidase [unclassified Caballeronia]|uniref:S8 family peptidase n=1 Tax=unclassified Caballeronia TaxID=2646786 RepID=UPI00285AB7FA|nr:MULTISPECIES: S8 family peptidase [unclassified Caballeronia]MDR5751298.1 S8 family peptidase [Caballeronia sp. LZ024]MDR5844564.1 S8 family peptidase [Caballeronia sp. LZ031]
MAGEYPLLYIQNPKVLRQARKTNAGGTKTDFFADRDDAFAQLRVQVTSSLKIVQDQLQQNSARFCSSGFVKVRLQEKAWAKTHRPVKKLFTPANAPVVGGDDIGELIVRTNVAGVGRILESVGRADETTSRRFDSQGRWVVNPNRERSEVGTLEGLRLWSAADRRLPDSESAVGKFARTGLAPMYAVRLFDSVSGALEKHEGGRESKALLDTPAESFVRSLKQLAQTLGVYVVLDDSVPTINMAYVGLTDSPGFAIFRSVSDLANVSEQLIVDGDYSDDSHNRLLELLGEHPNVRTVSVPHILSTDRPASLAASAVPQRVQRRSTVISVTPANIPEPEENAAYPMVAVVDGGISDKFEKWVKAAYGKIPASHRELDHATNIAGLLVGARHFNPGYGLRFEDDGCWLIDVALHAGNEHFGKHYGNGSARFMDELERVVEICRREHGVRVFNFSLNNKEDVIHSDFSEEATRLDKIAREHDVFFVISAGNTHGDDKRPEWDKRISVAAAQLIESKSDTLWGPADSLLNISVGAMNGAGVKDCLPDVPACYSRRGPGVRGSVKPDVCHIGGADGENDVSGLLSVSEHGMLAAVKGTSMAAPLVAKTLAALDMELAGAAPREVVQALFLHNTYFEKPFKSQQARRIGRSLIGFGYPRASHQSLALDRHTFGVVVYDNLQVDENTIIDFRWPKELVDDEGRCRGLARLTLVCSPPLDFRYGAEVARINLELALRQRKTAKAGPNDDEDDDSEGEEDAMSAGWQGRAKPVHAHGLKRSSREAALLVDGLKWSPVKVLEGNFKGTGRSAEWRLCVNYVLRDQAEFPKDGIPFAVVLTISDPEGAANVYGDLAQELVATSAVRMNDIRAAMRIRPQAM